MGRMNDFQEGGFDHDVHAENNGKRNNTFVTLRGKRQFETAQHQAF
jgi:hypothetical protein